MTHKIDTVTLTFTDYDNEGKVYVGMTISPPAPEGDDLKDNEQSCLLTALMVISALQSSAGMDVSKYPKRTLQ